MPNTNNKVGAAYVRQNRERKRDAKSTQKAPKRAARFAKPNENDPVAWLLAYLPGAFPLPFGSAHHQIIDAVAYAIHHAGNVAIAAPRGTGKSTLVNGLTLWALLTGRTAFPVVIPWDDKAKRRSLRFWAQELCHNKRLLRDYPDAVDIFHRSRGIANRLAALTINGNATGARLGLSEGIIVLPNGLGAIGSATINGNPRGLNYATITGEIVRPTFAIIDDPQDRETARSKSRVAETVEVVMGDIAGMAGPDQRMAMVMPCTVIERGDVAEHFLSDPDWRSIRVGQITAWPAGWDAEKSEARRLWLEWNEIRQAGEQDQDAGKTALAFYAANKQQMTHGMTVSWGERYDKRRGQPDALYAAMFDYFTMGHDAFMAERQNEPVVQGVTLYNLTPDVVQSRINAFSPWEIPPWSRLRIAATDINYSYGLSWTLLAFGGDQTSVVVGYGIHRMGVSRDATKAERERAIFEQLVLHGRQLASTACKPEAWFIDASGEAFDIALRFAASSVSLCGIQAIAATGRGARNYRPYGKSVLGRPREQCHMAVDGTGRKWVAWNADYWREQAQKAWTGSVGAPGSCSLPAGHHRDFAEQICREQLQGKSEIGGQMVWVWNTAPGPHDYGDCMSMCYMGAAFQGIGTSGILVKPAKHVERRKARVPIET
jgi:energy-coupling factor transporter ATP-binding protein EcfA2